MYDIRDQISEWMNVERNSLYEIGLEDIEFSEYAQRNIHTTFQEMMIENDIIDSDIIVTAAEGAHIPCRSYWVEQTRELVIFLWNKYQYKAIVIPENAWMVRSDITIH
jgi:hypothetical protein